MVLIFHTVSLQRCASNVRIILEGSEQFKDMV